MTLGQLVDGWIADARRRIHKSIDRKCRKALGENAATVHRSTGQIYRDREAELRDATDGRR